MTLTCVELLSLLASPLLLGAALLHALGLRRRADAVGWLGWCAVAGSLTLGLVLYAWVELQGPLDWRWIAPVVLALAAALELGSRTRVVHASSQSPAAWSAAPRAERWLYAAVLASLVALMAARILLGNLTPVLEGDEANLWAMRAKLLFQHGGLTAAFVRDSLDQELVYHSDYPLLDPLLELWAFCHARAIVHVENRLPLQLFALALPLVLGAGLRRRVRPALAAALTALVVCLPLTGLQARSADADHLVALGLCLALDGWLRARAGEREGWPLLALGAGFAAWSKNEALLWLLCGLAGAALSACLPGGAGRGAWLIGKRAAWLLVPLAVTALTFSYNARHGFQNDMATGDYRGRGAASLFFEQFGARWEDVLRFVWNDLLARPEHDNLLVLGWATLCLAYPLSVWRGELRAPNLSMVLACITLFAVYVGSPHELRWHLETSAPRVCWQLAPSAALLLAYDAGRILPACRPRRARGR